MYPFEVDSYVCGHILSDDALNYDATRKRFIDQSGYGERGDIEITAGTPVFATVGGYRGVLLDNTCHGKFPSPIPWNGTVITVLKPYSIDGLTTTIIRYPLLFGDNPTPSVNGRLQVLRFGASTRRISWNTASDQLKAEYNASGEGIIVIAHSTDQETRKGYVTIDGVSVTESTAAASTTNGNAVAMQAALTGTRWGNVTGVAGNTTAVTDFTCYQFEQHFFSENLFESDPDALLALMTRLRSAYGIA